MKNEEQVDVVHNKDLRFNKEVKIIYNDKYLI